MALADRAVVPLRFLVAGIVKSLVAGLIDQQLVHRFFDRDLLPAALLQAFIALRGGGTYRAFGAVFLLPLFVAFEYFVDLVVFF